MNLTKKNVKKSIAVSLAGALIAASTMVPIYAAYNSITPTMKEAVDYIEQPSTDWKIMKNNIAVKGIYLTGNTVASSRFQQLVQLVASTELNAVVIDVKDDEGFLTYESALSDTKLAGANSKVRIKDIDAVIRILNENNIYPIARIVTFKDKSAGDHIPQLAVKNKNGGIWRDRNGMSWLNPYNKEAWDYIVDIAEEAVSKGFKEIQFDYVRFPTDGKLDLIDYGTNAKDKPRQQAIADFLSYARNRLNNKGVVVSADVFGLVTSALDDMHIGQYLEPLAVSTDVICPMVYPSHYAKGTYGVAEPDFEPYKIVNASLKTAKKRIDSINTLTDKARLRPWLQDFSATYLPKYKKYGAAEVRAQIQAANDAGVSEWILWNAGNYYTKGALKSE